MIVAVMGNFHTTEHYDGAVQKDSYVINNSYSYEVLNIVYPCVLLVPVYASSNIQD